MRSLTSLSLVLSFLAVACNATRQRPVVDADPATREALLSSMAALEGRWQGVAPDGSQGSTVFTVSSAGSAVRELMLEGTEHEMTNMYTLDGNTLVMTHYCAGGNQPRMRATSVEDGRIVFRFDGVQDLKSPDELYMGELTIVRIDDDHIEEHWRAFRAGELDHEMTIAMQRR